MLTVGELGSETGFFGRGAGGDPTAVAVLSDVLSIARHASPPGWFGEVADDRATVESCAPRRTTSVSCATSRASSRRSPTRWRVTT